jgi:hypothetical protein
MADRWDDSKKCDIVVIFLIFFQALVNLAKAPS